MENREENKAYNQVTSAYVLEQIGLIQQRLNDEQLNPGSDKLSKAT